MALTPTEQEAVDRLAEYNGSRYVAGSNERGMGGEGYKTEIPRACNDMGTATAAVARMALETTTAADRADATVHAIGATISLLWDTGTTDADPGAGEVRAVGAVTTATYLCISDHDAYGLQIAAQVGSWGAMDTVSGDLHLRVAGNTAVTLDWLVTGPVFAGAGYLRVPVTYAGPETPTVPAAGAAVTLGFVRAGKTGGQGPSGNNRICDGGVAAGTANAPVITASPVFTGARGECLSFIAGAANTGAVNVTANDVTQPARLNGAAFTGGELPASTRVTFQSDGTSLHLVSVSRPASTGSVANSVAVRNADGGLGSAYFQASGPAPLFVWYESDGAVNGRRWSIIADGGKLGLWVQNDAGDAGTLVMEFSRNGTTPTGIDFKRAVHCPPVAVNYASTLTLDFSAGNDFIISPLTGNLTLANPTGITAGQSGSIVLPQDGAGNRSVALGSFFKTREGAAIVLTTTAGRKDRIDYWCETTSLIHIELAKDVR